MKFSVTFLLLILVSIGSGAQSAEHFPPKIYIVRHAEKETGNDPGLTAAGRNRAGDLMRILKKEKISAIYVTQYKRTQMTADSMRILLHIDTLHYLADTLCEDLLSRIKAHDYANRAILIIGHSNTIPKIIRKLGVLDYPQENIPDTEFDDLFRIQYLRNKAWVTKKKYGAPSSSSAAMKPVQ
jgi:phosphohistidine phosphatase SixA